jgi:hypothetical protein
MPSGPVNSLGQKLTFSFDGGLGKIGQYPFSVRVIAIDDIKHFFIVETLGGHPLRGLRFWGVKENKKDQTITVYTGDVSQPESKFVAWGLRAGGDTVMRGGWTDLLHGVVHVAAPGDKIVDDKADNPDVYMPDGPEYEHIVRFILGMDNDL